MQKNTFAFTFSPTSNQVSKRNTQTHQNSPRPLDHRVTLLPQLVRCRNKTLTHYQEQQVTRLSSVIYRQAVSCKAITKWMHIQYSTSLQVTRCGLPSRTEQTQTNKQPSRQSDALPSLNVGYRCLPPSLSPPRTLAGADKLALAAARAQRGKTELMLATGELIGSPAARVMSPNTSHIQIKVTQRGSYEGPDERRRATVTEIKVQCQCGFVFLNTNWADQSSRLLKVSQL